MKWVEGPFTDVDALQKMSEEEVKTWIQRGSVRCNPQSEWDATLREWRRTEPLQELCDASHFTDLEWWGLDRADDMRPGHGVDAAGANDSYN